MCRSRWQHRWQLQHCWKLHLRSCPARLPCPPPARSSRPARASGSPAWCMPGLHAAQQGLWRPSQGCNMLLVILKEMLETPWLPRTPVMSLHYRIQMRKVRHLTQMLNKISGEATPGGSGASCIQSSGRTMS